MERHTKQNYLAECCADEVSTVQEKFRDTARLFFGSALELEEDRMETCRGKRKCADLNARTFR